MLPLALMLHQDSSDERKKREEMAQNSFQGHGASQRSVGLVVSSKQPHFTPMWGEFRRHL